MHGWAGAWHGRPRSVELTCAEQCPEGRSRLPPAFQVSRVGAHHRIRMGCSGRCALSHSLAARAVSSAELTSPRAADACHSPPPASPLGVGPELRHLSSHASLHNHIKHDSTSDIPPTSPKSFTSARSAPAHERRPLLSPGGERNVGWRGHASYRSTESTVILADYLAKPSLPLPLVIAHQLGLYFARCVARSANRTREEEGG